MSETEDPCAPFRELLSPAHDGELTPHEELSLQEHLEGCASCREARARLFESVAILRRTPFVETSGDFLVRLDERLDREARLRLDTLPRAEVALAGAPTLAVPSVRPRRLVANLKVAAVFLCLASSTFFFLEALERRRGGNHAPQIAHFEPLPEPTPTASVEPTPAFQPTPAPIDDPDVRPGPLEVTPSPVAPSPEPSPEATLAPTPAPEHTPLPTTSTSPQPGTQGRDPSPAPSQAPAPSPQPTSRPDGPSLSNLLAAIFVDPNTPADQRPNQIAALGEYPVRRSYDALGSILAGALDSKPLANECRGKAYAALGAIGTEDAAKVLCGVRGADDSKLLLALAQIRQPKGVVWLSQRVADAPDESLRILVARALGKGGHEEALDGLAKVLAQKSQPPLVRAEAARALGGLLTDKAREPLVAALKTAPIPAIRGAAAHGLGTLAAHGIADAGRALVVALAKDGHPYVRESCALAIGRSFDATLVGSLVERLDPKHEASRRVRSAAGDALVTLTGQERTLEEWQSALKRGAPVAARGPAAVVAIARDFADSLASGEGTVFVLDRSGSMGERGKMQLAKETIERAIDKLPETARDPGARGFSVLCFADTPVAFFPRLVEPTPENLARARLGLERQRAWFAPTDLLRAIHSALSIEGTDTLVLVTDGVPTLGVRDADKLLLEVAKENATRGARIHVVALENGTSPFTFDPNVDPPQGESPEISLLRRLALDNGGVFVKN